MAIEKKELKDVSSGIRSAYQKVEEVIRKNNRDYAIELLKGIVQKQPGFLDARKKLRELETSKADEMGGLAKFFAGLKTKKFTTKGMFKVSKEPLEAMKMAEEALAIYLYDTGSLNLLADAAVNAGGNFIAIEALEIIREIKPEDEANLRKLKGVYEKDGQGTMVLQVMQQIARIRPGDLSIESEMRAATALASMQKNEWEKEGSVADKQKDKDAMAALEQEDRIIRAEDDVNEAIERYEAMIAEGDTGIDNRRKLANFYQLAGRHDEAIECFNWVVGQIGSLDPALDKAIEKSEVAKFDVAIAEAQEAGSSEEEIQELVNQRFAYRLERGEDRVKRNPSDLMARYELGLLYWEAQAIDNAIEQFQHSRKNPNRRGISLVYLGRCFHLKGQSDMGIEQFEQAISTMLVMDKEKMNALYHMGVTYEEIGNTEKAMECFKDIYQVNANYLDVSERINQFYAQKNA